MENNKEIQKGWLERLKNESWEAELLVSAIAIYGTFQLFGLVDWVTNFFINVLNPSQYYVAYFITFFGLIAISVLASMFIIHFVLRAYWVGLVGLNSVFPDYSIEDSAYSKIYTQKILAILPKLKDSIKKADELCSVIFSVAFTFLFMFGYMAIFASIYLLIYNLLSAYIPHYILIAPVIITTVFAFVQMSVTYYSNLKSNKEKEKLQEINFLLVKYNNMLMVGPLYKNILQVSMIFMSNFKKKKALAYLMLMFLFSGIIVAGFQIPKTNILYLAYPDVKNYFKIHKTYSDYYKKDNKNNTFLLTPEITSDKIESNTFEVFIPVFNYETNIREEVCGEFNKDEDKTKEENDFIQANHLKDCYKKTTFIFIDDKPISVDFIRYHNHPRTNQFGLLCFISIKDLKEGLHKIKIEKKNNDNKNYLEWTIPFYYSPK